MRFLFSLIFLTLSLMARESCYSVQLFSAINNKSNQNKLNMMRKDKPECNVMEISNILNLRCGCFETYKETKEYLKKFQGEYEDAYICSTYKDRFDTQKQITSPLLPQEIKNFENNTTAALAEKQEDKKIETPIVETKNKAKKKKKKKKKKKESKTQSAKYVKKRELSYPYQKYLYYLQNNEPIAPYGYNYEFGGQISYDIAYIDQKEAIYYPEPNSYFANDFRRVRFYHAGNFFQKKLFYELEYSFIEDADNFKDFYVGYQNKLINNDQFFYRVKAGNIKVPFSLERYTTSKNLSFMERPLGDDAFAIGRKLGVELFADAKIKKHRVGVFLSAFSNSIDERKNGEVNKPGISLRTTYNYEFAKRHLFHIGIAQLFQNYNNEDLRYKQNLESSIIDEKYVSTKIKNTNDVHNTNLDLFYQNNKYSAQGGFLQTDVSADKGDYNFYSYFVQGGYFIRGKGKRFDTQESKFSKIKPNKDGAIEVAIRYSYINLNDKDEQGGKQTNYSLGLNWYLNREITIMGNYIYALPKGTDDYNGRLSIYQARILFAF